MNTALANLGDLAICRSAPPCISNPRKIYPADPGLIPAFDASGRVNLGHALETVILNEQERRKVKVGYVKTADGLEVDFLARYRDTEEELIQVCADLRSAETAARELRAFEAAAIEHPQARGILSSRSSSRAEPLLSHGEIGLSAIVLVKMRIIEGQFSLRGVEHCV